MLTLGLHRIGRFDEALITKYYPVLLEAYDGAIDLHTVMYPGAMEAVAAIKADGIAVGRPGDVPFGLVQRYVDVTTRAVREEDPGRLLFSNRFNLGGVDPDGKVSWSATASEITEAGYPAVVSSASRYGDEYKPDGRLDEPRCVHW